MTTRRSTLWLSAAVLAESAVWAAGANFSTELQAVSRDRYRTLTFEGRKAERFELRSGDCYWDVGGKNSRDCKTGRERVERFATRHELLNKTFCYSYGLYLPSEYGEMQVKSTLGQFHDKRYGDAISLRYLQGRMWLSQNIGDAEVRRVPVAFKKGAWNDFVFRIKLGHQAGEIHLWHNDKKLVGITNIRTLPDALDDVYFKYGIYRSHLAGVTNRPTQIAYYSNVRSFAGDQCDNL